MRKICVDTAREAKGNHSAASFCISASRAYTLMLRQHQRHLAMAARECKFQYVRFHGLFQDDMGVYREDAFGNPIWGWQYVDEVYDFLMEIGVRPFVVFDFMPEAIRSGDTTIYWEKANITPPKDLEKWSEIVFRTVRHFVERYGEEEVAHWFFEVWNEPDGFFFAGSMEQYMQMYEASARAVKRVSAALRVGGPAIAGEALWIERLIDYCVMRDVPLDFISAHSYCARSFESENRVHPEEGYPVWNPGVSWPLGNICYDPRGGEAKLDEYNLAIAHSAWPELPLYVTEWGLTYDYWDPLRDSYEAASFLLSRIAANEGKAECLSLCEVSDIFEEDGPPTQSHFHGGFGLVNLQGIRKPAYFAYKFLAEVSRRRLECEAVGAIAGGDCEEGVQVLFWDDSVRQNLDNKHYYSAAHPPRSAEDALVQVKGLKEGDYSLAVYGVGYRENDAYTAFLDMPPCDSLSREEAARLNALADGSPMETAQVRINADGCFEYTASMRENDVRLIKLTRRK